MKAVETPFSEKIKSIKIISLKVKLLIVKLECLESLINPLLILWGN